MIKKITLLATSLLAFSTTFATAMNHNNKTQFTANAIHVTYPLAHKIMQYTYVITTATGKLTKIVFPENTKIISIASNDTLNWTTAITRYKKHTLILLIKPTPAAASSTLMVTTNHHIYNFKLANSSNRYMSTVNFSNKINHPRATSTQYIYPANLPKPTFTTPPNEGKAQQSSIFLPNGAPRPPKDLIS